MLANNPPTFLLASPEPALLSAVEPVLMADGAQVEIFLSAEAALAALTAAHAPSWRCSTPNCRGWRWGSCWRRRAADASGRRFPIVLFADTCDAGVDWTALPRV